MCRVDNFSISLAAKNNFAFFAIWNYRDKIEIGEIPLIELNIIKGMKGMKFYPIIASVGVYKNNKQPETALIIYMNHPASINENF